jgi:purine-binding chemotaxis protein CheW
MAGKGDKDKKHVNEVQVVVFRLSDEKFGLEISQVKEIIRMQDITPMPKASEFIEGVINLRGRIIAVISMCRRFEIKETERTSKSRIIVAEAGEDDVGLIVDEVPEVVRISEDDIDPAPEMLETGVHSEFIRGVAKVEGRIIVLLDMERILSHEETEQISKVSEKKDTGK